MEVIQIILYIVTLIIVVFVTRYFVRDYREVQEMKAERARCFLMISRCSLLLRLLQEKPYSTPTDIAFLRSVIYRNYVDVYYTPCAPAISEEEMRILAEGLHYVTTHSEEGVMGVSGDVEPEERERVWGSVLMLSVKGFAGISRRKDSMPGDMEWIYYLWLICGFVRAVYPRSDADRRDLVDLCNRVETWAVDCNSVYLNEKIRECREFLAAG